MPGTLSVSELSDGANTIISTVPIVGCAKAWVYFNTSATRIANYNVSSVTRQSAGNFTVNFANALPTSYYAVTVAADTNGGYRYGGTHDGIAVRTTTSLRVNVSETSSTDVDAAMSVAVHCYG